MVNQKPFVVSKLIYESFRQLNANKVNGCIKLANIQLFGEPDIPTKYEDDCTLGFIRDDSQVRKT